MTLEDIGPELSLWGAVVVQLIEDALDYHRLGPDRHGYREEAHHEMQRPGRMLHRLCGRAGVDRDTVLTCYQRRLRDMPRQNVWDVYSGNRPVRLATINVSKNGHAIGGFPR